MHHMTKKPALLSLQRRLLSFCFLICLRRFLERRRIGISEFLLNGRQKLRIAENVGSGQSHSLCTTCQIVFRTRLLRRVRKLAAVQRAAATAQSTIIFFNAWMLCISHARFR